MIQEIKKGLDALITSTTKKVAFCEEEIQTNAHLAEVKKSEQALIVGNTIIQVRQCTTLSSVPSRNIHHPVQCSLNMYCTTLYRVSSRRIHHPVQCSLKMYCTTLYRVSSVRIQLVVQCSLCTYCFHIIVPSVRIVFILLVRKQWELLSHRRLLGYHITLMSVLRYCGTRWRAGMSG